VLKFSEILFCRSAEQGAVGALPTFN